MRQSIVSVHFPKAGGSSLRTQLQSAFGAALLLDYSHDPLGQAGSYIADSLPPSVQMVHGHFRPTRYAGVRDAAMITFLRNPIDCLLSVYYFWLDYPRNENSVHGRFLDERPTIIEFARWSLLQRLMSATYFGGFDMNRFSFVGFHESRSSDLDVLSKLIGVPLDPALHVNRTASGCDARRNLKSDRHLMSALADVLADDLRFYDEQRQRRSN
jgi:hypothetical protein